MKLISQLQRIAHTCWAAGDEARMQLAVGPIEEREETGQFALDFLLRAQDIVARVEARVGGLTSTLYELQVCVGYAHRKSTDLQMAIKRTLARVHLLSDSAESLGHAQTLLQELSQCSQEVRQDIVRQLTCRIARRYTASRSCSYMRAPRGKRTKPPCEKVNRV